MVKHAVETCQFQSHHKFKVQASAGKIMCTVFWDTEGTLQIDYMPHKVTVSGVYYANLLGKMLVTVKEKCRAEESWPRYPYFAGQCICSQVTCWISRCTWMWIWRKVSSTIFPWPDTEWLPSISNFKETPLRTKIFDRWWAQVRGQRVVEVTVRTILFYTH